MLKKKIYWLNAEIKYVDSDEYSNVLHHFQVVGKEAKYNTSTTEWFSNDITYKEDVRGYCKDLYVAEKSDFGYDLFIYRLNGRKLVKDIMAHKVRPQECKDKLVELFKEYEGVSLCKAFKPVDSRIYRNLVPKSSIYLRKDINRDNIPHVNYADVSSMFPAMGRGRLPDAHTAVEIKGRVKPNEEYPFAFYLKSHHCAEYGVFDTHDYLKLPRKYQDWQCYTDGGKPIYRNFADNEEVTVLMKASEYELTRVFERIYQDKLAGDPVAKEFMNVGIGTLHKNPYKQKKDYLMDYYHVAAIILGRANAKQYEMVRKIEKNGGLIYSIITDSIIYTDYKQVGKNVKKLGEYYAEFTDVNFRTADAINRYVLFDNEGKILKCVIQGIENPIPINRPEDIDFYNKKG